MKSYNLIPQTVQAEQLKKVKKATILDCLNERVTYHAFPGEWEIWKEGAHYPEYMSDADFKRTYEETKLGVQAQMLRHKNDD